MIPVMQRLISLKLDPLVKIGFVGFISILYLLYSAAAYIQAGDDLKMATQTLTAQKGMIDNWSRVKPLADRAWISPSGKKKFKAHLENETKRSGITLTRLDMGSAMNTYTSPWRCRLINLMISSPTDSAIYQFINRLSENGPGFFGFKKVRLRRLEPLQIEANLQFEWLYYRDKK